MYVLNFFLQFFQRAGRAVVAVCSPSLGSQEAERLVATDDDGRGSYTSLGDAADTDGDTQRRRSSILGLTGEYKSFWETNEAIKLCCMHLGIYVVVAVLGYSYLFEKWPISDSIYFAVVIFTTVGYGDLSPSTDPARAFTIFFAFYGIVVLGIFLGLVGEFIIAKQEESIQERLANCRLKVMEQFSTDDSGAPPSKRSFLTTLWDICLAEIPIILVLLVIAIPIIYLEGWDPIMGVYWMVVTGSTVGFGDLGPTHTSTRVLCIIFIPISVAVMGEFLGRVAGAYIERRNDEVEDKFMSRAMTLGDLNTMDTNKDQKVSPDEFLCYMLVAMQKVEKEEIDEIMELFAKLDKSKTGLIEKEDLLYQYQLNVRPGVTVNASTRTADES